MDTSELVTKLAVNKSLRIERWPTELGHWRVGLNWFSEDDYEFVCEKPTLLEALDCANDYYENIQTSKDK